MRRHVWERWSEADIALLRRMAAESIPVTAMATRLKRSVEAVRKRALKEGIKLGAATEIRTPRPSN